MSATYTVVTLDGQEHANLNEETVKEWFLRKKLREDSFVLSSETGEWKILKKVFNVSVWLNQNFGHAPYQPQQQWNAQPQMPQQAPQQQWQPQTYSQPMPQQQAYYPQQTPQQNFSQPTPQQQPQYHAPQQEVNAYWQQQQQFQPQPQQPQYQPQPQWISQQSWVAPPPPANPSFVNRVMGVFESASGRAKSAIISLYIILGTTAGMGLINIMTALSPPDMEAMSQGQINPSAAFTLLVAGLLGIAHIIAFIVTVILFLMWLHRAYKNLQAFGVATDDSPGWVVGYWFIPIVNLFRPYQKVNELFEKSDATAIQFRCNNQDADSSIVGWWWACYLLSGFIGWAANKTSFRTTSSSDIVFASVLDLASCVLSIIAAIMIIRIIKTINEWHEACASVSMQNQYPNPYGY